MSENEREIYEKEIVQCTCGLMMPEKRRQTHSKCSDHIQEITRQLKERQEKAEKEWFWCECGKYVNIHRATSHKTSREHIMYVFTGNRPWGTYDVIKTLEAEERGETWYRY